MPTHKRRNVPIFDHSLSFVSHHCNIMSPFLRSWLPVLSLASLISSSRAFHGCSARALVSNVRTSSVTCSRDYSFSSSPRHLLPTRTRAQSWASCLRTFMTANAESSPDDLINQLVDALPEDRPFIVTQVRCRKQHYFPIAPPGPPAQSSSLSCLRLAYEPFGSYAG